MQRGKTDSFFLENLVSAAAGTGSGAVQALTRVARNAPTRPSIDLHRVPHDLRLCQSRPLRVSHHEVPKRGFNKETRCHCVAFEDVFGLTLSAGHLHASRVLEQKA